MKNSIIRNALLLTLCLTLFAPCALAQAPSVNFVDYFTAKTPLDLSAYRGKTIVLNFFTEWCYYCMQEMPDFREVNDLYDPEALQIVMVHVWDGEDETSTQNVQKNYGMEHMTFFEDEKLTTFIAIGAAGFPATLVINPDGELVMAANYAIKKEQLTDVLDGIGVPRKAAE